MVSQAMSPGQAFSCVPAAARAAAYSWLLAMISSGNFPPLAAAKGKIAGKDGAAAMLGIPPSTFSSRMKALGVER